MGETAQLLFRPVLCQADPRHAKAKYVAPGKLPACGADYQMTAANLAVNTSTGAPTNNIAPDPAFTDYQVDDAGPRQQEQNEVILPVLGEKGVRYVLGPSELSALPSTRPSPSRTRPVRGSSTTP